MQARTSDEPTPTHATPSFSRLGNRTLSGVVEHIAELLLGGWSRSAVEYDLKKNKQVVPHEVKQARETFKDAKQLLQPGHVLPDDLLLGKYLRITCCNW